MKVDSVRRNGDGQALGALEHDSRADRDGAHDLPAVQMLAQDHEGEEDGEEGLHVREQRGARRADAVDGRKPEDVGEEQRPDHGVREADPRPGVEMEALTAVSAALLTVYDMCKAVDKTMAMSDIKLISKTKTDI